MGQVDIERLRSEGRGSVEVAGQVVTLRCEQRRGQDYWYAYRRVGGKLRKRYIGPSSSLSIGQVLSAANELVGLAPAPTLPDGVDCPPLPNSLPNDVEGDLRGELAAVSEERDRLASELSLYRAVVARYQSQIKFGANGKVSPRWDVAQRLLAELAAIGDR